MGTLFQPTSTLSGRHRFILSTDDMVANQQRADRAAFAIEKYADVIAKEDSPGPVQSDEEREVHSARRTKQTITADMKLSADFIDKLLAGGLLYGAKENGPETGAV